MHKPNTLLSATACGLLSAGLAGGCGGHNAAPDGASASSAVSSPAAARPASETPSAAPETRHPSSVNSHELEIYAQVLDDPVICRRIAREIPPKATRVIISFAAFESDGTVRAPEVASDCAAAIRSMGRNGALSLGVGGYGDDAEHAHILAGWAAAIRRPDRFTASALSAMHALSETLQAPVTGVDLDCEYPTAAQAAGFSRLVVRLRQALPGGQIGLAVPADPSMFPVPIRPLARQVNSIEVMTYDMSGPWSDVSGNQASTADTVAGIKQWKAALGSARQLIAGYPTYAREFVGATGLGKPFDQAASIQAPEVEARDLPSYAIHDNPKAGAATAVIGGNLYSFQTAADMAATARAVLASTGVDGAMLWSDKGLMAADLTALSGLKP